jgi:hypothetical protein
MKHCSLEFVMNTVEYKDATNFVTKKCNGNRGSIALSVSSRYLQTINIIFIGTALLLYSMAFGKLILLSVPLKKESDSKITLPAKS